MEVIYVTATVKPEHRDRFMEATLAYARDSLANEPGCLRFDVLQDRRDNDAIHLYEVYRDEAAVEAHRHTEAYHDWRRVAPELCSAPIGRNYSVNVFPTDDAWV